MLLFGVVLAACSIPPKHATGGDDDPTGDSGTGSDGGSAATTMVEVTVLSLNADGLPDTGAVAMFLDPSGTLIADGLVDAAGHAQADMPGGGSVTVLRINDETPTHRDVGLTTITSVRPGDKLVVGDTASPMAFADAPTTMAVTFTPYAANYSYMFYTACGGTGGSAGNATLYLYNACHGSTFDLLAVATSSDTPPDVRYVAIPNVPYAANGSITVPNAWSTTGSFMATLANVPANLSSLSLTRSLYLGEATATTASTSIDTPHAGLVSVTAPYVQGLGTRSQITLGLHEQNASGFQTFVARVANTAGTQGLDLGQEPLPWIAGVVSETPTTVSWDQIGTGAPDVRLVTWSGYWSVGTRTDYVAWTVEDGDATSSLTLPGLPAKYAELDPTHQTTISLGHAAVQYLDYDRLNGYDEARKYGPQLGGPLEDLGVFVDEPVQVRISHSGFFL